MSRARRGQGGRSVMRALAVGLGSIVALVLLLVIGLLLTLRAVSVREARIRDEYYPRLLLAQDIRSAMVDQETGVRGFIVTGDERFLDPFIAGRDAYLRARDDLAARPALSRGQATLRQQQFDAAERWYSEVALPQIATRRAGTSDPEAQLASFEQAKQVFDAFRAANDAYAQRTRDTIANERATLAAQRRATFVAAAIGSLLVIAATIAVSVWLVRLIRRPLAALIGVAGAVERGDVSRRVPPLAADEFQQLGHGMNVMLDTLAASSGVVDAERRRLERVVSSADEGIVVVGADGAVQLFNPAAERLFGQRAAEVIGRPASGVPFLAHESAHRRPASADARPEPIVRKEGERVLSAMVSPLAADGGEAAGGVWIVRDVTELARIDEMKNEFISIVSHELRTPLTAIKGFTDLILEGDVGEVTAEQREFLEIVQANSDRLVALINDMLDISRIEAGRLRLDVAPLNLRAAIDHSVVSFRPMFDAKNLTVQTELAEDVPTVQADEARLQQILANLISNAVKYTPAGGWITIRANAAGGQAAISVSDTGVGIPSDALPRLFSKFYRVDQAATAEIGGTGLGLSITKALVELHGGRITIASRPGAGTTVRFTLPRDGSALDDSVRDAVGVAVERPWAEARAGQGHVLLAEDDPEGAFLTQRLLAGHGFEVTGVPDGLAALVRAIEWLPDAIILDVNMPKMGVAEVLGQLRANPGTRDIPVIVLTGGAPDARASFIEAGADDVFAKPVDIDALATRLTQLLQRE